MSIGYLPGPHREDCPVFARIAALDRRRGCRVKSPRTILNQKVIGGTRIKKKGKAIKGLASKGVIDGVNASYGL